MKGSSLPRRQLPKQPLLRHQQLGMAELTRVGHIVDVAVGDHGAGPAPLRLHELAGEARSQEQFFPGVWSNDETSLFSDGGS